MIRTLPSWYGKVEDDLRRQIALLANENNIRWQFVYDSKIIDESINNIMNVLLRLKEEVRGEFNEEEIKEFKKFEELEKGIKKKEIKTKESKSKIKGNKSKLPNKNRSRKVNKKVQKRKEN